MAQPFISSSGNVHTTTTPINYHALLQTTTGRAPPLRCQVPDAGTTPEATLNLTLQRVHLRPEPNCKDFQP